MFCCKWAQLTLKMERESEEKNEDGHAERLQITHSMVKLHNDSFTI